MVILEIESVNILSDSVNDVAIYTFFMNMKELRLQ